MNHPRTTVLLAAGVVLSAVLCIYGALVLHSAHATALAAQNELTECSRLSRTLALLKSGTVSRETLATLLPDASVALGEASAGSGIPAGALQIGQPFPAPAAAVSLPVRLQGCTLEQLIGFVYRLSSELAALQVQSLVLTASAHDQALWDADLTLTCNVAGDAAKEGR